MKIRILFTTAVLMTALLTPGPTQAQSDFIKDSVVFDRAYIAVLAVTNKEDTALSPKAMVFLKQDWPVFKAKYQGHKPDDPQWAKDFAHLDELIAEADRLVTEGRNLLEAHEVLEGVRYTFLDLRRRNNIEYFIDHLTEFHHHMEEIALTAKGKTPQTLSAADLEKINKLYLPLKKSMTAIAQALFDPALFGFNEPKTAKLKNLIDLEAKTVQALEQALAGKDLGAVIKTGQAIKPHFVEMFLLFGDFERLRAAK